MWTVQVPEGAAPVVVLGPPWSSPPQDQPQGSFQVNLCQGASCQLAWVTRTSGVTFQTTESADDTEVKCFGEWETPRVQPRLDPCIARPSRHQVLP